MPHVEGHEEESTELPSDVEENIFQERFISPFLENPKIILQKRLLAANEVIGLNSGGTLLEYKAITAGTGISITNTANSISIAHALTAGTGITITGASIAIGQSVATTASPTFANLILTDGGDIRPSANSTSALSIAQADGTDFVTFDTTNKRVGFGADFVPSTPVHIRVATDDNLLIRSNSSEVNLICVDNAVANAVSWSITGNPFYFRNQADDSITVTVNSNGGIVLGSATGGNQGLGTLNGTAIYDDGVLLTCYVAEYVRTGKIDLKKWDKLVAGNKKHSSVREFLKRAERDLDPKKYYDYFIKEGHLPSMPSKLEWVKAKKKYPMGTLISSLWEAVEVLTVHIGKLSNV